MQRVNVRSVLLFERLAQTTFNKSTRATLNTQVEQGKKVLDSLRKSF